MKTWLIALLLALGALAAAAQPAHALPSYAEVRAAYTPSDAQLLARDGRPLQNLRIDLHGRRLAWVALADISPALQRAVILSEDRRFHQHAGVDWQASGKAAWNNLFSGSLRGASTLTMQLVGLLDEDGKRRGRRSLFEKISQTAAALRIERSWSKQQILEAYLNLAHFRGELEGVAALSRGLFGKWPEGLDEREAALSAALLRAPNATTALVARRACALLREQDRANQCQDLDAYALMTVGNAQAPRAAIPSLAPHLARKLLVKAGQSVRSTLDADVQETARTSLRRHLSKLARQHAQDGAVVVLDNRSGEVLAWVGSSGDLSGAAEVDGVLALRQAGSTLKPFLYGLAFERKTLTPASLIEDASLALDTGNGLYAPQNYEPDYRGWVSARWALAGSLNVPAVKTLMRIGPDDFAQRLRLAGLTSVKRDGDWYGYSLALGSADVSLLMMANAYRSLANGGRWSPLRALPGANGAGGSYGLNGLNGTYVATHATHATSSNRAGDAANLCRQEGCTGVFGGQPRTVFDSAAAYLVGDILADGGARAATFGLESWLATPYWAAAKTGTSKDMRDNWCIGYSQRYTVGVWIGNADGRPMHDVSGVSGAAPVWREVMDWLHRGDAARGRPMVRSVAPDRPAGIVARSVRFENGAGAEPARQELFIAGTENTSVRAADKRGLARIAYPADGTVIALDADIPPGRQRLALRASAPLEKDWQWRIDQRMVAPASGPAVWLPQPGRHLLTLTDASGNEIDRVVFEVRALRRR